MFLVICMAGFNTRFHDAGFDVPKYLLPWDGGVILDGILSGLEAATSFSRTILLANQRDQYFKGDLLDVAQRHGIGEADIVYIPDTKGQAHTAAIGAQIASSLRAGHQAIAFHNSDTILIGRDWRWLKDQLRSRDVFIDVFPAASAKFSYVAIHEGKATKIKEKQVISPFASSGFYAFKSAEYYLKAFDDFSSAAGSGDSREIYLSDIIQTAIDSGADVFINEFNRDLTTTVLGSPEEYGLEMARKALRR